LVVATEALAQEGEVCEAGRIARIEVQSRQVFEDSAGAVVSTVYSVANSLHRETHDWFIRRELLVREGDCYDEFRLGESERLLRDYRFLQSADVTATRRSDGNYNVYVVTQDDWSLRIEPRIDLASGVSFTGVRFAERNIWGTGQSIEFAYIGRAAQDEIGLAYFDPQFLRSRWDLDLAVLRSEPGWSGRGSVGYPFVGLVGTWAAFADVSYSDRWFTYFVGDSKQPIELLQPTLERAAQAGGALRRSTRPRGENTKLGSYGVTLSYERLGYSPDFFQDTLEAASVGMEPDAVGQLAEVALRQREAVRLNLVVGVRGLDFVERRGVSTLRGVEDLAIGASADLMVGLATKAFGSTDSHAFIAADAYGGSRVRGNWFFFLRASFEGRRDYVSRDWRDVFGAIQAWNFWLLSDRQSIVLTGRWSAGWETTAPFQLTLGGPRAMAGYATHRFPGGARGVVRLENRSYWTTLGRWFDLGTTAFVDVGQMWANKAIFGTNSSLRASVGAGIRVAAPVGSRSTYRLEVAFPVESGVSFSDMVFTFSTRRPLQLHRQPTDPQLERSRDSAFRSSRTQFR
jgi:hypothetical protein